MSNYRLIVNMHSPIIGPNAQAMVDTGGAAYISTLCDALDCKAPQTQPLQHRPMSFLAAPDQTRFCVHALILMQISAPEVPKIEDEHCVVI